MLDEIKKSLIEDIDGEISSIEEEVSEYTVREQQISDSIYTKVGIIDRLFKTKKYKEKIKSYSILRNEESDIYEQKRSKESKLKELYEKKNKIKKIDDVKNLPFKNGEEIRNYCQDKNISITSEDYFKYFREEVSINDKLMMSFVKENLSYLKYDKSNNLEIYKYFLYQQIKEFEDIKETLPNEFHQEVWQHETFRLPFYKELIKLLDDNSVGVDFKNHITEWIRSKCDYFVSFKEMNSLYNKDLEKYYMYLSSHNLPLSLDIEKIISLYQSDYGQELEKIYKNDDYIIGMHGTNYITENVEDNDFFKKGIRNSKQTSSIRCLDRTVAYNLPFFELLDYNGAYYAPGANVPYNYIITIPKEIFYSGAPIWGSKEANSDDNYLLPEFIYGVFDQTKIDDKEKRIIKNNLPNKEKYSVFYADYSDEPIYYSDEIKSVPRK